MMSKFSYISITLLVLYVSACMGSPADIKTAADTNQIVTITGFLVHEEHWGPPNFGEQPKTDSKFFAWLVKPCQPITVQAKTAVPDGADDKLSKVQVNFDLSHFNDAELQRLVGSQIIVSGKLWTATSQGDITPVVITAVSVAPASVKGCIPY